MPTNTTYLQMSLYNSTTDGSATFASFRAAIDGISPTSNFNILDTYAQNTSASIIALQARSIYVVPAIYVSPNYYEANSLTSITSYTTNMYIDLYVDTTNVGSVTLNINALGTKTLKKIDATGALIDLASNDLEKNKEYLFRYNGTVFVWVAVSSGASTTYSGSALITVSGSKISHNVSGAAPGSYLAANVTVDDYGHITSVANGASASSTGAPADTPFLVSGSVSAGVTNAKELVSGSNITLITSGSTLIVATSISGVSSISGSSIMSDTTGSSVKHNYSGIISGSYNKVDVDSFGHITSASIVPVTMTAISIAGQVLSSYDSTTGSFTRTPIPTTATGVSGRVLYSYDASTGSFVNVSVLNGIAGSSVMSDTSGSQIKHNYSGVVSGSYNQVQVDSFGHIISASIVGSGTTYAGSALISVSGSKISHNVSGTSIGSYLSANVTVDDYGHITSISNGASASSVGAPADTPFLVSGSVSAEVTNAKQLLAGTNITLTPSGSTLTLASSGTTSTAGSSVMSDTTGSQIKHNYSGVTAGSANKVQFDSFGHITSASIVLLPITATGVTGRVLYSYDSTTGSFVNIANATTATAVANKALYSYDSTTGSFTNVPIPITATGVSNKALYSYDSTTGSFTNTAILSAISGSSIMSDSTGSSVKHNYSAVTAGSANKVQYDAFGHIISASIVLMPITATQVSGKALDSYNSATGSFTNIPIPVTSTAVANRVLNSYASTTGSFTNTPIPLTSAVVSGRVFNSYDSTTGSFTNIPIPVSASGTGKALSSYDSTTGSFVNSYLPITAAIVSNKALDSYNSVTGSFTNTTILPAIAGSSIMSDTTGSQIKHNYSGVTAGSANKIQFDSFGHITTASIVFASESIIGDVQLATSSQTTTGSAINNLAISPSGLAHSNYGIITVEAQLNGSTALTTNDKAVWRVPSKMNGFKVISVAASGSPASTSGSPTFTVKSGSTSMLTTNVRIDQGATDSSTSSASAVIDTSNNIVYTGNRIEFATSVAGTGVLYAIVEANFQSP